MVKMSLEKKMSATEKIKQLDYLSETFSKSDAKWVDRAKVLKILSEQQQKLQEFGDWLKKTEWRGVSSEVLEEFQERFAELGVKPVKKEVSNKQ